MATATLVPTALDADANSNIASGTFGDIDNTIASASGTFVTTVTDEFTGGAGTGTAFTFTMTNVPSDFDSINTVQFRSRSRVNGTHVNDLVAWRCDVTGVNAPGDVAEWIGKDDSGGGLSNRGAASAVASSATESEINAWIFRVYQAYFDTLLAGDDGLSLSIDELEVAIDYNTAGGGSPSPPPASGAYAVIPTTDTVIFGLACATVRDFSVLGGLDTDRYAIRWSALGDPTDWPTPATDDARAKQAGTQTFPTKHGFVTGIAGNDFYMYVFQERAITKGQYVGGDVVFSFDIFEEGRGCVRQGLLVQIDDLVFFQSDRGYHALENDVITDIGYGIVDGSFN